MSDRNPHPAWVMWFEPLAAVSLFVVALAFNRESPWPLWWLVDLITLAGSAISYRRPALGAVLTATGMVLWLPFTSAPASISGVGALINVFAAFRLPYPRRFLLSGCLLALVGVNLVLLSVEAPYRWDTVLLLLSLTCLTIGGGVTWREAQQRLKTEAKEKERALIDLRSELARELHDTVAQTLSSATMRANLVALDEDLSPEARTHIEAIAAECSSAAHDLRQLLSALRDKAPSHAVVSGSLADINSLLQTLNAQADRINRHGIAVETSLRIETLSSARAQTMSAIVTEAANNIIKHARPATICSLRLFEEDGMVVGEFANVPRTGVHARGEGMGLLGVQERVALLQGSSEIVRTPGHWMLRTLLPQNPAHSPSAATSGGAG